MALGPGPAGAGHGGETTVTSEPLQGGGYRLFITATAGQANNIIYVGGEGGVFRVRDAGSGVTDGSTKCDQVDETTVECKLKGLRRVNVETGDLGDVVQGFWIVDNEPTSASAIVIYAGSGNDRVELGVAATAKGGSGEDRLIGRRGNQRLFGDRGPDRITGGGGNNDHCDGGPGNDSGGKRCETIVSL